MVVVDTSVAIKWYFDEEDSTEARDILKRDDLGAPDLVIYEFANYLAHKAILSVGEMQSFLHELLSLPVQFFNLPQKGFERVLALSREFGISAYDASFVALAESLQADLVTADVKLCQRTKRLPFVKLLS